MALARKCPSPSTDLCFEQLRAEQKTHKIAAEERPFFLANLPVNIFWGCNFCSSQSLVESSKALYSKMTACVKQFGNYQKLERATEKNLRQHWNKLLLVALPLS